MTSFENLLIIVSALIVVSVVTSKASSRFGIPALLLFLIVGVCAGVHGFGGVDFSNYALARELGTFALIFILFDGGLSTDLKSVRPVLKPALVLSTLGVVIAAVIVGVVVHIFTTFSFVEALLLGTTIAATDVAAVFSVLRSKSVRLKQGLAPILELESALNDPMTVFLGVTLLGIAEGQHLHIVYILPIFIREMLVGSIFGFAMGWLSKFLVERVNLEYESLYPVMNLGLVIFTYAITQHFCGSGFLAVYIDGMFLAGAKIKQYENLLRFHDGLAWLGQIGMFLSMGLLVDPTALLKVAPLGVGLSLFLVFVARPLSAFACLPFTRFNSREKLMISWGGLRGAVPIILAMYVLASNIPRANEIFNLVFFITFFSVLLQGPTIPFVAKRLGVAEPTVLE